jgi:hypothetical protein
MKGDGPGQECAYSISMLPILYSLQDLPLSSQSSQEICFWPCERRISSRRMEGFPFFYNQIPAMLLRTPLARPFCLLPWSHALVEAFYWNTLKKLGKRSKKAKRFKTGNKYNNEYLPLIERR